MTIVTLDWNGNVINAVNEVTAIGKYQIPQGYINATQMCQANQKDWYEYSRLPSTIEYLDALIADTGLSRNGLIVSIRGGNNKNKQGTWVHPEVAIDLAAWISPKFRVWVNRQIKTLMTNGEVAIASPQWWRNFNGKMQEYPDPWERMYDKKFCDRAFGWFGARFYWDFCYHWMSAEQKARHEHNNPIIPGLGREHRIHQLIDKKTKEDLKPRIIELNTLLQSNHSKQAFLIAYQNMYGCGWQQEFEFSYPAEIKENKQEPKPEKKYFTIYQIQELIEVRLTIQEGIIQNCMTGILKYIKKSQDGSYYVLPIALDFADRPKGKIYEIKWTVDVIKNINGIWGFPTELN